MQLSKLTGAQVELKVFWGEDRSCVEYFSQNSTDLSGISKHSSLVDEYAKLSNKHYDFLAQIDDRLGIYYTGDASEKHWQK